MRKVVDRGVVPRASWYGSRAACLPETLPMHVMNPRTSFLQTPRAYGRRLRQPPRLDLANEDLVRAHVQAIWLTGTGQSLGRSLKDVLDVDSEEPNLELRDWVHDSFADAGARSRARQRTGRVLASVEEELLGYMVIRFGHQDDWNEMINQYPYIFGSEV